MGISERAAPAVRDALRVAAPARRGIAAGLTAAVEVFDSTPDPHQSELAPGRCPAKNLVT